MRYTKSDNKSRGPKGFNCNFIQKKENWMRHTCWLNSNTLTQAIMPEFLFRCRIWFFSLFSNLDFAIYCLKIQLFNSISIVAQNAQNFCGNNAFVMPLAIILLVGIYETVICLFNTTSLIQCCYTAMCFVCWWNSRFAVKSIAPLLSAWRSIKTSSFWYLRVFNS